MQFGSVEHDDTPHVWTQENVLRNVSDSLLKMQTDHIDLLQLHNPDPETVEEMKILNTLLDLQKSGVVRFLGCSTTLPHIETYLKWDFLLDQNTYQNWPGVLITPSGEVVFGINALTIQL